MGTRERKGLSTKHLLLFPVHFISHIFIVAWPSYQFEYAQEPTSIQVSSSACLIVLHEMKSSDYVRGKCTFVHVCVGVGAHVPRDC